ncbi:MAG: ECF transporter S component [Anaerolineaceae bacterium]|nr:MAG: ECF transporter S component [Anaerolineaceae bacterium]
MNTNQLKKFITAALMAALTCFATYIIRVPSPTGYIHPGDSFVILSGIILGPLYGALSAGIGSMLADILAAYPQYAVATLIIKALTALICSFIYRHLRRKMYSVILAGLVGGIIVTLGYFSVEYFMYGFGGALSGVPLNGVQNIFGIILSTMLYPLLYRIPQIKDMMKD